MRYCYSQAVILCVFFAAFQLLQNASGTVDNVTSECNRYINFEVALQCRAEGNLLKYGLPKCKRFASAYANFTQTGQEFIECTAKCLADDFGRKIIDEIKGAEGWFSIFMRNARKRAFRRPPLLETPLAVRSYAAAAEAENNLIYAGESESATTPHQLDRRIYFEAALAFADGNPDPLAHQLLEDMTIAQRETACDRLKAGALRSHERCYLSCNFCRIFPVNLKQFIAVFDRKEFGWKGWTQVMKIGLKCGKEFEELKEAWKELGKRRDWLNVTTKG